jgi:hypothetical protein
MANGEAKASAAAADSQGFVVLSDGKVKKQARKK